MKNKLTSNLGTKILSLAIAMGLWLIVTTINDPSVKQTYYNIPVKLTNTELITDSGRVYEVLDNSDVISRVTITAPRSVLSEIDDKNVIAVADVNNLSSLDTITVDVYADKYNDQIAIKTSTDTVKLNIENKRTKTLALSTEVLGTPNEGYMVGNINTDQNLVRVTGAESVIDSISKAEVSVDVSGFASDIGTNAEIRLLDDAGEQVSDSRLQQNIKSVGVTVEILQVKEIPIICELPEEAAQGYCPTGIYDQSLNSVKICGRSEALKNINEIDIPKEAFDLSDKKSDYTVDINLSSYLPENVAFVNSADGTVTFTIYIEAETVKYIALSDEDINVVNVPAGYIATIAIDADSMLELRGLSTDLAPLNKNNIMPTVDVAVWMNKQGVTVAELEDGFYNTTVGVTVPARVKNDNPVSVVLHISKPAEQE